MIHLPLFENPISQARVLTLLQTCRPYKPKEISRKIFFSDAVTCFHFDISPFSLNVVVHIFPLNFILLIKLDVNHFLLNIRSL